MSVVVATDPTLALAEALALLKFGDAIYWILDRNNTNQEHEEQRGTRTKEELS